MHSETPRENKNLIFHLEDVMRQLQSAYLHRKPEQDPAAFKTFLQEVRLQKADADTIAHNYRLAGELKIKDVIRVACFYFVHAEREYYEDRQEIAWAYLVEAAYYSGAASYLKSLQRAWPEIEKTTMQKAVAGTKSNGGRKKNARWKEIEDEAVKLVKILGEKGHSWDTERKMADSIKSELWPFANNAVSGVSEKQYVKTISGRLKLRSADVGIYLNKRRASS